MRRLASCVALLSLAAAPALADDYLADAHLIGNFAIGQSLDRVASTPGAAYSNIDTPAGVAYIAGAAVLQSGNTITRLLADDITPAGGFAGQSVSSITFSVSNTAGGPVTARPRIRFWLADGTASPPDPNDPGTFVAGFTFNPITFPSGFNLLSFDPAGNFSVPAGTFWAGVTFDDNNGGTGATALQLDGLGQVVFDPPAVGSSMDTAFVTDSAGSFLVNNPLGTQFNSGGLSAAVNFGWEFVPVPEPSTLLPLALGVVGLIRRR